MTLGERINGYRKKSGISQEELADKLNVSRQSISLWETDQTTPSLDNLITLAEIFNISMDELCGVTKDETPEAGQCDIKPEQTKKTDEEPELAYCETKVTENMLTSVGRKYIKKLVIICVAVIVSSVLMGIVIIGSNADPSLIAIPITFTLIMIAIVITSVINSRNAKKDVLKNRSDLTYYCNFYKSHIDVKSKSEQSYSEFKVNYADIKRTDRDGGCLYAFLANGKVLPINTADIAGNADAVKTLLKARGNDGAASNKNRLSIRTLLLVMFALSLLSMFIAITALVIAVNLSPLPEFDETMIEYMWVFFLIVPIPLSSLILGIIFRTKKYKCTKNIVAGVMMCVLLCIYGSFTFIFDDVRHDDSYLRSLDASLPFTISDATGYTSYRTGKIEDDYYYGMLKVDDPDVVLGWMSDNEFKNSLDDYPSGIISLYYSAMLSDYDYYYLYNVTFHAANIVSYGVTARYVLLAFDTQRNVLFYREFTYKS
ncbi:MAG: helix-turn-helix domain-containing protein [Firmicutes bacterium]|nr:helix-turn-helix domain-containing protein [Bacillota bacterium]